MPPLRGLWTVLKELTRVDFSFLYQGLLNASFGTMVLYTLVMTHITIVAVTVYLHRYSAHRALELNGALKHFFRFWLWLTTGKRRLFFTETVSSK